MRFAVSVLVTVLTMQTPAQETQPTSSYKLRPSREEVYGCFESVAQMLQSFHDSRAELSEAKLLPLFYLDPDGKREPYLAKWQSTDQGRPVYSLYFRSEACPKTKGKLQYVITDYWPTYGGQNRAQR